MELPEGCSVWRSTGPSLLLAMRLKHGGAADSKLKTLLNSQFYHAHYATALPFQFELWPHFPG